MKEMVYWTRRRGKGYEHGLQIDGTAIRDPSTPINPYVDRIITTTQLSHITSMQDRPTIFSMRTEVKLEEE